MTSTVETSIVVMRSPREVFDYVSDVTHLPEWRTDIVGAGLETPGPMRLGSRGWDSARVMGRERRFDWEVTDFEEGERYGIRGVSGPVRPHVTFRFTPQDGGTRVDYALRLSGHGPLGVLRHLLIRRLTAKRDTLLVPLKERLEA